MNYKKMKVLLAVFMAIIMVFSSTVFGVTKQGVVYTALGDSIAYGTGATDLIGYTDLFNAHLNKVFREVTYLNLSYDGATSKDLLDALLDEYDTFGVQSAVGASDVITISIGGNDLLGPFRVAFEDIFDIYTNSGYIDFELLLSDLAEWESNPATHTQFNDIFMTFYSEFPALVTNFTSNWVSIIERIRDLNHEADIYVNTVFNPLKFSQNLYQFADPVIQGLNVPIHFLASTYNYKVVDVYSKFEEYGNPKKLAVGDLSTLASSMVPGYNGPVPLHPTDMGYKFIFNMHKDLMD